MQAKLRELGAEHAARMHAAGAAGNPDAWSEDDWRAHIDEEERLLFPRLPPAAAARLRAEHATFLGELARFGRILSREVLDAHSALEDELVGSL